MVILNKDLLPKFFEIASPSNSHFKTITNTFDFISRNSNILIVTVGESWVYGTDLDENTRLDNCFGNIVTNNLKADWLNLGQPGIGNFWIAEKVEEFGRIISSLHYKKILVICVFSEIGRSFNSHHDAHIDFIKWFNKNSNFDNFLKYLNSNCAIRIKKVCNEHNLDLLVATNFVDPIGLDTIEKYHISEPWFRLLNIDTPLVYTGVNGAYNLRQMKEFVPDKQQVNFLEWFNKLSDNANLLTKYLGKNTKLMYNLHPTKEGHAIWADHLIKYINV